MKTKTKRNAPFDVLSLTLEDALKIAKERKYVAEDDFQSILIIQACLQALDIPDPDGITFTTIRNVIMRKIAEGRDEYHHKKDLQIAEVVYDCVIRLRKNASPRMAGSRGAKLRASEDAVSTATLMHEASSLIAQLTNEISILAKKLDVLIKIAGKESTGEVKVGDYVVITNNYTRE